MEKIIIVMSDDNLKSRLNSLLQSQGYQIAGECHEGVDAVRLVRRVLPDLLIIGDELCGLRGFDIASIFIEEGSIPVLLIAKNIDKAVYNKAKKSPFFIAVRDSEDDNTILMNVHFLLNSARKVSSLKSDLLKKEKEIMLIKNLNLAKGILIERKKLSEKEAHQFLQKEA